MCAFCLLKQGCEPLRWPSFSLKAVLHQCAGLLLHILFAASKAARRTEYLKAAAKDVQKVAAFKKKIKSLLIYVPVNLSNSIGLIQSGKIPVSIRNSRFA